ncbi:unnamed protein product [Pedinophyceae sp. YPF-701]|nr:unnamed protein product [Pedinophyceae sp. YPF-701]
MGKHAGGGGASSGYAALGLINPLWGGMKKNIFIKRHRGEDTVVDPQRSLFVCGMPLGMAAEDLGELLGAFGDVENTAMHASGTSAMVLFAAAESVRNALALARRGGALQYEESSYAGPRGLKRWVEAHKARFPGNAELQASLDAWVEEFEQREEEERLEREAAMAGDGWTLVTSKRGRKKTADGGGTTVGAVTAGRAAKRKRDSSQDALDGFYRFQRREKRRDELMDLRRRFDADRKRIADLRAQRKFKPG